MTRTVIAVSLLCLAACDGAPASTAQPTSATEEKCVFGRAKVTITDNVIRWNGDIVDEAELARRAAAHWCGERPYAITTDQAVPHPDDRAAIELSLRVSRLIGTKQATLAETLRKLADGTY